MKYFNILYKLARSITGTARKKENSVATSLSEPRITAPKIVAPLREDRVTEADRHAEYQKVAPAVEDGLYLVPRVVE